MSEDIDELNKGAKAGKHSVDTNPVKPLKDDSSDNEFDAPFKIEAETVFKSLARDIYENDKAGIREPLTNAITAILRANEYDYIEKDEGVVKINVEDSGNGVEVSIRDNGIGMTMERIRELVANIGVSETRDIGDMAGQFGLGFLAVFRLVGVDGGCEMHTNPRYSEEGPISGIWKGGGGFTRDANELMSDDFDEDEYGTKFNFILKSEIDRMDVRKWVSEYAEWSRVPVIYEESVSGQLEFEENYGGFNKTFKTDYRDELPVIEYEDDFVYAVTSQDSNNQTILLDVPCKRNSRPISTLIGGVDIRLKNENGVVVEGPHKGDMVVSEGEFKSMDEERKQKYVPKNNLTNDDVVLPRPTGNRRILEENPNFWNWIENKLESNLIDSVESTVEKVQNYEDLLELKENEYRLICLIAEKCVSRIYNRKFDPEDKGKSIRKWFQNNTEKRIDKRLSMQISALVYPIMYADRGSKNIESSRHLDPKRPALPVYRAYHNNGDIFMGCELPPIKAEVIWEDDEYNYIFAVDSTDQYKNYEDLLGWNKMVDINRSNIDEFDISDKTKASFLDVEEKEVSKSSNSNNDKIKMHFKDTNQYTKDIKVSRLEKMLKKSDGGEISFNGRTLNRIILFPSHMNKQISDNYWVCDERNPIARCQKKDWERLKKYEQVETLEQRIENARTISLKTSKGNLTIKEFEEQYDTESTVLMLHILEEPYLSRFMSDELIGDAEDYVNNNYGTSNMSYVYAPITKTDYRSMKPCVRNYTTLLGDFSSDVSVNGNRKRGPNVKQSITISSETKMYAYMRLKEWSDTEEYEFLKNNIGRRRSMRLDSGGYELIETIRKGFKSGPFSNSDETVKTQIN